MFDLKFFKFLHSFLVNLWDVRYDWHMYHSGRMSKEKVYHHEEHSELNHICITTFLKIYPEYVHWLGLTQQNCSGYGGSYWGILDIPSIPLFKYNW
jgi:hypothetical protein